MPQKSIHCIFRLSAAIMISFTLNAAFAQEEQENKQVESVAKFTIINPGIAYEAAIGKSSTLYTQAFMNLSTRFDFGLYDDELDITYYFDPALTTQYRFYYNYNKRNEAGKRTAKNSLNFVAPIYEGHLSKRPLPNTEYEESSRRLISTIGAVWGMQRNYAGRFSLDLYTGLGYTFAKSTDFDNNGILVTKTEGLPAIIAQVNIGIWLGKQ